MKPSNTSKNKEIKTKTQHKSKFKKPHNKETAIPPPHPPQRLVLVFYLIFCKIPQAQNGQACIEYKTSTHKTPKIKIK